MSEDKPNYMHIYHTYNEFAPEHDYDLANPKCKLCGCTRTQASMVNELQARLHSLYNGRTPLHEVGPQTVGLERYRLTVTGNQLYALLEAADRIGELEALLTAREDTLVCMREEYLHLRRITESARDLLQGEFYAEALGELDDACSHG